MIYHDDDPPAPPAEVLLEFQRARRRRSQNGTHERVTISVDEHEDKAPTWTVWVGAKVVHCQIGAPPRRRRSA